MEHLTACTMCVNKRARILALHTFVCYELQTQTWCVTQNYEMSNIDFIHSLMALQPFVGPWPFLQ
jgi:hypothetical protein